MIYAPATTAPGLLIFILGFLFCSLQGATPADITGKVVGVHDGDTITLLTEDKEQVKVRLEGIDAPELGQPFGKTSKEALSALVFGQHVVVNVLGVDRYKRTLGRVRTDHQDVNLALVVQGLAWHYAYYSKESALKDAQDKAQAAKIGLWSVEAPVPPWEWRKNKP